MRYSSRRGKSNYPGDIAIIGREYVQLGASSAYFKALQTIVLQYAEVKVHWQCPWRQCRGRPCVAPSRLTCAYVRPSNSSLISINSPISSRSFNGHCKELPHIPAFSEYLSFSSGVFFSFKVIW